MASRSLNRLSLHRPTLVLNTRWNGLHSFHACPNTWISKHSLATIRNPTRSWSVPLLAGSPIRHRFGSTEFSLSNPKALFSKSANTLDANDPPNRISESPPQKPALRSRVDTAKDFLGPYMELARVDKPIGTMLLLWPCGKYS